MKSIKQFLYLILASFFITACGDGVPAGGTLISGNFANADNITAYFDKIDLANAVEAIGSTEVKGGKFSITLAEGHEAGMYRVRMGSKSANLVLDGTEKKITVTGDLNTLPNDYTVEGSPLSSDYAKYFQDYKKKVINETQLDNYIINDAKPLVAMMLALAAHNGKAQKHELFSKVSSKLTAAPGMEAFGGPFGKIATSMANQFAQMQAQQRVKVGEVAPDIVSEDPSGKTRKLSDLKGQIVLLDFWASWCGPCRRSNPMVVDVYNKYKSQGFTVFNVSLDGLDERTKARISGEEQLQKQLVASKKRWTDAIAKDNLTWPHHVSDLKKWDSAAAKLYGVRSIPSTFLIDKDGTLAAINPTKSGLENAVKKLL